MIRRPAHTDIPTAGRIAALAGAVVATAGALGVTGAAPAEAASLPQATVHADGGLHSHVSPSTQAPRTYTFADGAELSINCGTKGTSVQGNPDWYLVSAEGDANWVSGAYLELDGKPKHCGPDLTTSAKAKSATHHREGPTRQDADRGALKKGDSTEVLCYTDSGDSGQQERWMVTLEEGWLPASALKTDGKVPYCEKS